MKNSKELRESLSKEAYEFINEKFSLELMYKNYENSIKEMIYNE
jgi:glycosyltransferase involved in cell wall biosynthesis